MNFNVVFRVNPATSSSEPYFRLMESFRNEFGEPRNRTILTVGFDMQDILPEQVKLVAEGLTRLHQSNGCRQCLFGDVLDGYPAMVRGYIEKYWRLIVANGKLDVVEREKAQVRERAKDLVDADSLMFSDARSVGAEWVCLQAIRELKIDRFLEQEGWSKVQIDTALAQMIVRTIYGCSELKSTHLMRENSAVCELLSGDLHWQPSFHGVYRVAPELYQLKDKLETHLCRTTDDLFNITNSIILYDLTNFYFEGRKAESEKAKFGRSKEKRIDCKLLVLALCINTEGFIRYSSILAGNTSDPASLPDMVDTICQQTRTPSHPDRKILVCLDAGIATEDNLRRIKDKGYNYLCVSRSRLTDYELVDEDKTVKVIDAKKQEIILRQVQHQPNGDYYLQISSPAKAIKDIHEPQMAPKLRARTRQSPQRPHQKRRQKEIRQSHRTRRPSHPKIPINRQILHHYLPSRSTEPRQHGRHPMANSRPQRHRPTMRSLLSTNQHRPTRRTNHMGLLQPHPRNRMHQSPTKNRPQPAPNLPPKRQPLRCPPLPRPTILLDRQHHPPQTQTNRPHQLLDRDRPTPIPPTSHHHRSHQRLRRKNPLPTMHPPLTPNP